jgi:NTP pyrophosphatase (non-canonical NTP hydrolase)
MMDERERRNIMTRAIQHFGETAQIDMAVEEMAELTKAICKVKRAQAGAEMGAAVENVVEEIADVQIMLDQLRLIFARSTDEVVACTITTGADATDAGYRPHWATCPQAGTFRAPKYRKFDIKEPKARTIDTPRCTWKEGDCHE